jgi:hypothetical protein
LTKGEAIARKAFPMENMPNATTTGALALLQGFKLIEQLGSSVINWN